MVEIPPINSLINKFAFTKAYIEPISRILENKSVFVKSKEKVINKIKEINNWTNNNEQKVRIHIWKNQVVFSEANDKKANGAINKKTLTIIYLNEYDKIKLNRLKEIKHFSNPSIENKLKFSESIVIVLSRFCIKLEKQMLLLNKLSPIWRIAVEIYELNSINFSQIKGEKFIKIVNKTNLNINGSGLVTFVKVIWDKSKDIA